MFWNWEISKWSLAPSVLGLKSLTHLQIIRWWLKSPFFTVLFVGKATEHLMFPDLPGPNGLVTPQLAREAIGQLLPSLLLGDWRIGRAIWHWKSSSNRKSWAIFHCHRLPGNMVDGCEILQQPDGWSPNKIMGCLPPTYQLQDFAAVHRIRGLVESLVHLALASAQPRPSARSMYDFDDLDVCILVLQQKCSL